MLLKKIGLNKLAALLTPAFSLLMLLMATGTSFSAPCDTKSGIPFIRHDLSESYCELCNFGYVTVVISNPYIYTYDTTFPYTDPPIPGATMTNMVVVENLGSSGLVYDPSAPAPFTASVNGTPVAVNPPPGGSGSTVTFSSSQIPALASLSAHPSGSQVNFITISFAVRRTSNPEGLVSANRSIQATLTFNTDSSCTDSPESDIDTLPLREPDPVIFKRGRNVDASQTSWSQTVYGNEFDDVIWRIQVRNDGDADLQDLRFDDLMQTGNLNISYICPTAAGAAAVAVNNGVNPGGTGCLAAGNSINNFDVDNPFGNPGNDSPDLVDVTDGTSTYVYLVGKVPNSGSGVGSCSVNRTNTVSDVQWGCEAVSPAGGITTTSDGSSPGTATATLSTLSNNNLNISVDITGVDPGQPAGARGRVRITIRNRTGGTVKNIRLRDVLPVEYVMDPTFAPQVAMDSAYGAYPGMTDNITWNNSVAGTYPTQTSNSAADYLNNRAPEFALNSNTVHPIYGDQVNMLRHGDDLTITFGIIMIDSSFYDRTANLDVRQEAPGAAAQDTDPDNDTPYASPPHPSTMLANRLEVQFENFCQTGVTIAPPAINTTHDADPEDLDLDITGSELVFILTGDPAQRLPLTVDLTNRGGHDAEDFTAYITFGRTMEVVTVPAGCTLIANPPLLDEWRLPAPIPADATIYRYQYNGTSVPGIGPGGTRSLTFEVVKSTDPADIAADDLSFRADVIGEITFSNPDSQGRTLLWYPTVVNPRSDGGNDRANNYSLDGIRARVVGFNLLKSQLGTCSENNPPVLSQIPPDTRDLDRHVQIGEECSFHIDTGGWFGFQTPGFTYIAVQRIQVVDELPNGQGYVSSTNPLPPAGTSTSAIMNPVLNPVGVAPVDEGWIDWTFNQVVPAERIDEKDHWFRVDMTSRILNDPVDTVAPPNAHAVLSTNTLNSTFQAVFFNDSTGMEEVYDLGPDTVGYPRVEVRRIALRVTEPEITVVKQVCNESLHGVGTSCDTWVDLADDGDAYSNYIYRITLTNEAADSGVDRAPAYDVTVTDTLDASDLAYVMPFAADGLDNDGDGGIGAGDTDGEGAISDNIVDNATPGVITFSYTHSTALRRIDPGASVQLYYRVDYDDDAAPLQTFTNSADSTYDSLAGVSGSQTVDPRPNSDIGSARVYTSNTETASVQIIPVQTQPKRITALSNTSLAGDPQNVSIGEEIEYRLNTLLPVAQLRQFVIRDELPAGLSCSEAPAVNLNAAPYAAAGFDPGGTITPTCTDTQVEWNFGDQRLTIGTPGSRFDFEIGFIAGVANTAGTNDGDVLSNGNPATAATARYIDDSGNPVVLNFDQVDVRVREPRIELTKSFAVANADAADVLAVTVTATNSGTAAAYNLRVLDDLTGLNMTFTGAVGGANPPDIVDTATLGANRPIFSWSAPNGIAPGNTVSFTFNVRVDDVVQPHEVLDNTIQADWTSLPGQTTALNSSGSIGADGSATGMRNGALPNASDPVNDYEATATDDVVVPPVTMTKTDLDPAVIPAIGAHKTFQIDIRPPEGVTHGVGVTDSLNAAGISYLLENNAGFDITYTFQGIATINGVAPSEAAFTAFPADGTTGSAVWDIGTVITQTENDASVNAVNPLIRITYFARINNDADTDAGDTLQNSVAVTYNHGETAATETLTASTAAVAVVEPSIGLAKTVTNITNFGTPLQAGDTLRYTSVFTAAGGTGGDAFSDAFDLRIDDSLSLGLIYSGNPTVDGAGNTIGAPIVAGDGVTTPQTLRWSLADGNADIDVPEGTTVTVTYDVLVDNSVLINQVLSNSATAQWTSLDGPSGVERNGTGAPWNAPQGTAYNDYFTGPAAASLVVGDNNTTVKTRLQDTFGAGDDVVRIGDIVEYELRLGLQEGTLVAVQAVDTLPQGLMFEEIVSINGDAIAPYTAAAPFVHPDISVSDIVVAGNAAAGPTTLTFTLGTIVNQADGNLANDFFVIRYRARVLNLVHPQVDSIGLTNTLTMEYTTATVTVTTVAVTESVDVRQPNLAVAKTAVAAGGDAVLDADELVTYTVDITNSGTAPAYDTVLRDIIPVGMRNGAGTITVLSVGLLSGGALPNLAPAYDAATGVATWDFDSGAADQYAIPAGDTLRLVYQVRTDAGLAPDMTLTNLAQVQFYYSFDDDAVPTAGGAVGVREIYGPTNTDSVTFTTAGAAGLEKASSAATAAIGQPFTYRITVPAAPQTTALHDVRILDDLGASAATLEFVRLTKVSGSWTPVNTGTATSLVIEDTATGIDIPAGEQIEIDITVRLADTQPAVNPPPAPNDNGTLFVNTAAYTYNQVNGDAGTRQSGGGDTTADMTIVGPDMLVMDKSGPASMSVGTPAGFVLDIHNTFSGAAWNLTVADRLPDDPVNGGTCGAGPSNIVAQFFDNGGAPTSGVLAAGTDYTVNFDAATCEWTLQLLSAAGPLRSTEHLVINYDTELDGDTVNAAAFTNVAGVTQWYGYDPNATDAAPHVYTYALTDGTPGDDTDQEDAYTINAQAPDLDFFKHVRNITTGQDPGLNASPGDTLHYTLEVINNGLGGLTGFSITDEVDGLNSPALFIPGSLVLTSVPAGAATGGTDPAGGANGTGLVSIADLDLGAAGSGTERLVVEFELTLTPVISSGTVALNQAGLNSIVPTTILSDDPNVAGDTNPTETLIDSAPQFRVEKISTDLTDDPAVLMAGDTLRYTITIKNIGDEDAVNASLHDFTPASTTYVPHSTRLNGHVVSDPSPGVNPLHGGIPINAPENPTPGTMRADSDPAADNTATVTFDVVVDPAAMDGLIIANQGFVSGDGTGSGTRPDQPSDDPDTPVSDDPTRDVVGNLPLLYALKTVALTVDNGTIGIVDPGDVLRYTIVVSNQGAIPATSVVLTDAVPVNTTYVADSLRLNGTFLGPDGGVSPLIGGLAIQSSDNPGAGIVTAGQSATITFEAAVNPGALTGTIISNQGDLTADELPPGLTDADGLPANGYQPTVVVVGDVQLLTITKTVTVVDGGPAVAGGQLEYVVRAANAGSLPATNVVLTDDLGPPMDTLVAYAAGSGTLNGAAAGVSFAGSVLTADYAATYGDLPVGATAELRFRVQINAAVATGTAITNIGVVAWNSPVESDSAGVSIDVGGTPGSATLNGSVWHDANLNAVNDTEEQRLAGWTVQLYRNGTLAATATTDAGGAYRFNGLLPNQGASDQYELRFIALGAGPGAATLGVADSIFTDGPHRISNIVAASGDNLVNLNLPITPNGAVYDSVARTAIAGARLTMRNAGTGAPLPDACFDDPNQQNQVTAAEGFYKFDLNFSQGACPAGGAYLIDVTSPATGYRAAPSQVIPPSSNAATAPYDVVTCPADAVPGAPGICEVIASPAIPPVSVPPNTAGTTYHLHLLLGDGVVPGQSQIFNNPIPIDPEMDEAVAITKTCSEINVTRGSLVPYTITVTNVFGGPMYDLSVIDRFPAGFKYVADSARLDGNPNEPAISGRQLTWGGIDLQVNEKAVIKMLLVVGSGVSEGEFTNRAVVFSSAIGATISGEAAATVQVVPDPDFDCTDVIGKVFDDRNLNGYPDNGETGLAGVRVVTARGLTATTDRYGRFHITCAAVPDEDRGSNFILKLDERSLPSGYRLTTENPRVQRATRGKMLRFNFGTTIHRVVRIDIADGVFEPGTSDLRLQWTSKIDQLLVELNRAPSVLRLAYLADVEREGLVKRRLKALKKSIAKRWKASDGGYPLAIETEVFWRRGAPAGK
ncbi:SdrD B-like domain-containing protein [uncultured Desulfosarcina sp.]|uniref:SdrD B-like domain-containing protein n=1 Tax=uncultured Desulfosarcina sp. TaxID=218289 RepID=UPI0029C9704A|nr:SdrD B-like domain-containing protein [uncultured Desulfosarcina sp.]